MYNKSDILCHHENITNTIKKIRINVQHVIYCKILQQVFTTILNFVIVISLLYKFDYNPHL